MNNLNFLFLEEYKHLDKLCRELYDGEPGVTSYVNDMKSADWNDARYIPNWKADLSSLIHLRHIRNHLAHTEGAFDENLCTTEDVNWLKDFRRRILRQEDPLAMLRKRSHVPDFFLVVSVVLVAFAVICLFIEILF